MIVLSCKIRVLYKALNHTYKTYTIISTCAIERTILCCKLRTIDFGLNVIQYLCTFDSVLSCKLSLLNTVITIISTSESRRRELNGQSVQIQISRQYKLFTTILVHVLGELLIVFYTNIFYDCS